MTIEQKINTYINDVNDKIDVLRDIVCEGITSIEYSSLPVCMASIQHWDNFRVELYGRHRNENIIEQINQMINDADETECLTSNSEYIRECKKRFMEKE